MSPGAPGWYPDPWSATGDGKRYFDGERWRSSERPLARHSDPPVLPVRPADPHRMRRSLGLGLTMVVLVGIVWGVQRFQATGSPNAKGGAGHATATASGSSTRLTQRPPPSTEESSRPLGVPTPAPVGLGGYTFVRTQPDDLETPVAFDPCRPIHYVINPDGAPPDGESLVTRAIARLHAATGLRFVDDGTTREAPSTNRAAYLPTRYPKDRWAPVLVAWRDEQSYPDLAGNIAGIGGGQAVSIDGGRLVYVTGQLVLDRAQLSPALVSDRGVVRAVILHELGHVVGLDHTPDRTQLMYSEAQLQVRDYGAGDLRGLAHLGTQRCFPAV